MFAAYTGIQVSRIHLVDPVRRVHPEPGHSWMGTRPWGVLRSRRVPYVNLLVWLPAALNPLRAGASTALQGGPCR